MSRIIGVLALALAAALIAAGCGDDDETTTTTAAAPTTTTAGATGATGATGEALTKSEFIKQADQICSDLDAEIEQQPEQPTADEIADNIQQQVDEVGALTPPEGDEDEIAKILDTAEEGVQQVRDTGDPRKAPALQEATQLLKQYGFKQCGQG